MLRIVSFTRTVHIYLTMLALILLVFFAATGFMLNHAETFESEAKYASINQMLPLDLVRQAEESLAREKNANGTPAEGYLQRLDDSALCRFLRGKLGKAGRLNQFEVEVDGPTRVGFVRPGRNIVVTIQPPAPDADSCQAEIQIETRGIFGTIGDLHRGKESGRWWPWFIDATAIVLFLACLSGAVLWLSAPRRRLPGLIFLILGAAMCAAGYWFLIP